MALELKDYIKKDNIDEFVKSIAIAAFHSKEILDVYIPSATDLSESFYEMNISTNIGIIHFQKNVTLLNDEPISGLTLEFVTDTNSNDIKIFYPKLTAVVEEGILISKHDMLAKIVLNESKYLNLRDIFAQNKENIRVLEAELMELEQEIISSPNTFTPEYIKAKSKYDEKIKLLKKLIKKKVYYKNFCAILSTFDDTVLQNVVFYNSLSYKSGLIFSGLLLNGYDKDKALEIAKTVDTLKCHVSLKKEKVVFQKTDNNHICTAVIDLLHTEKNYFEYDKKKYYEMSDICITMPIEFVNEISKIIKIIDKKED